MGLNKNSQWIIPPVDMESQERLMSQLGIKPVVARLLLNRGFGDLSLARTFLWGTLADLHSPFLMKDLLLAAQIILSAVKRGEKICIYGDYDVDGLTGTALLWKALRYLQADVVVYLPKRLEEGYGLKAQALDEIKRRGVDLLVTVDCGITACAEVLYANKLGIRVIITDHHQLGDCLPDACAVVNPHQPDCTYPFKDLAGVGVALKLAQGLLSCAGDIEAASEFLHNELDMVALGTIADVSPLYGENRLLVKYGLNQLTNCSKSGIKALKRGVGFEDKQSVGVTDVGYKLAPRLNAVGRLGDPLQGFNLLVSEDDETSEFLARQVEIENYQRQVVERKILEEARSQLAQYSEIPKVIVLAADGWHVGVIGIVASRLVEEFYRPTVIIALQNGVGKGSARSIRNFHMQQSLNQCKDLLLEFGGHGMAAGLSISTKNVPVFRERINHLAGKALQHVDFTPVFLTDGEITLGELSLSFCHELQQLAPFGLKNPSPSFCVRNVQVVNASKTMVNNHLKLKLSQGNQVLETIGFNMGDLSSQLTLCKNKPMDVVFRPQINVWQGREQVQLCLQDIEEAVKL